MRRLLTSFDEMPRATILMVNLAIGLVFGILPVVISRFVPIPPAFAAQTGWLTTCLLVGSCLIVLAVPLPRFVPTYEQLFFFVHAVGLLIVVGGHLAWMLSLLRNGLPKGEGFHWTPGIHTGLAAWAAFVLGRAVSSSLEHSRNVRARIVLAVGLAVFLLEASTLICLISDFYHQARMGGA